MDLKRPLDPCLFCHRPTCSGGCLNKSERGMPRPGKQYGDSSGSGTLGKAGPEQKPGKKAVSKCGPGCAPQKNEHTAKCGEISGAGAAVGRQNKKAEGVPTAKPPSGNAPNKPAPVPKASTAPKTPALPKQPAMKSELVRAQMLSVADTAAAELTVGQLAEAAAHHYLLMEAAAIRKDEATAGHHAHAGTLYERLLGWDPQRGVHPLVFDLVAQGRPELAKAEPPTQFTPHAADAVSGEGRLWKTRSEELAKVGAFGLPGVRGAVPAPRTPMTPGRSVAAQTRKPGQASIRQMPRKLNAQKYSAVPVPGKEVAEERENIFGGRTATTGPASTPQYEVRGGRRMVPQKGTVQPPKVYGHITDPKKRPSLPGITVNPKS